MDDSTSSERCLNFDLNQCSEINIECVFDGACTKVKCTGELKQISKKGVSTKQVFSDGPDILGEIDQEYFIECILDKHKEFHELHLEHLKKDYKFVLSKADFYKNTLKLDDGA